MAFELAIRGSVDGANYGSAPTFGHPASQTSVAICSAEPRPRAAPREPRAVAVQHEIGIDRVPVVLVVIGPQHHLRGAGAGPHESDRADANGDDAECESSAEHATFGVVAVALIGAAAGATYLPARRATRISAAAALRASE